MSIGEFADLSGLSPKRLRSYAAAGLLVPAAVDAESGYRYYAPGQLREARVIDALRRADVPLADIGTHLRDPSSERLDEWARQVEVDKAERDQALRHARELLDVDVRAVRAGAVGDARKERSMGLSTTTRTDIGRIRATNEDRAVGLAHLVAVADGMGGLPGGETA
jgi:protein phosphatase